MSVIPFLTSVLGLLPGIFKKKKYCLWYWEPPKWELKGGPFSHRQCRGALIELLKTGMSEYQFLILRHGVQPPPFFDPPVGKPKKGRAA